MKSYGILCVAVAIIMLLAPISALIGTEKSEVTEETSISADTSVKSEKNNDTVSVFLSEDNKAVDLDMRDYVIGVVAAEMPASYEAEALKAQAVVAATYAEYSKTAGSSDDIGGADLSDDSSQHQGYLTEEEMRQKWGDAYDECYNAIADAVDSVEGERITYDGEIIMPAYHAISCGRTQSAESVWGKDIPYLQSTDSEWDKSSTRYEAVVTLSADEICKIMENQSGAEFSDKEEEWVEIKNADSDGVVGKISICSVEMKGTEARKLLGLRSAAFEAEYSDGEFVFTVYGYGHGVGMSQNGANQMAKEGKTYKEIIEHYYKGVEII